MTKISHLILFLFSACAFAQTGNITGTISSEDENLQGVSVSVSGKTIFAKTDSNGKYQLQNVPAGKQTLVISAVGYRSISESVNVEEYETLEKDFVLKEDLLNIENVVITSTRHEVPQYNSPVIVSRIDSRLFNTTQSLSLSEGLNFTPGLRMETNCQNCGFNQVRMNGLEGSYSQILINSRPIFSALVGVYGLEMLPTSMIDRVEVVRGGGSALYGGNAIAGTINVITKDPTENTFELGTNYSFIDNHVPDRTINLNGSIVSDDYKKGLSFYAYNRDRKPFDANDDGFSEITKLKNTTFGFDAFWNTSDLSKLKLNLFNISEFRRGGNKFNLPPHQTDITEQLDHKILGGGISFEQFSSDLKHKFSIYGSAQGTNRNSYYGGGGSILEEGDVLTEEDVLAINAYGKSDDLSVVGGLQYSYEFNEKLLLLAGSEYQINSVEDRMPGYNRLIDQDAQTIGAYAQLEIKPTEKWTFLVGGRYDNVNIDGLYDLDVESFKDKKSLDVFEPRVTAMYSITDYLKARASFSQGYKAPQAFDEDLHTETVGGAAMFTKLDPDLKAEHSNSFNASLNFTKSIGSVQTNIVLEGFHTKISDAFITSDPTQLQSGIAVVTKRNGSGASVTGANLEASFAVSRKINFQLGGTFHKAEYKEDEVVWEAEDGSKVVTTKKILRTPDMYGYYTFNYMPTPKLTLSLSGVYTGKMDVPHVIDIDTEESVVVETKTFFESHAKVSYDFNIKDNNIKVYAGIQNMFNSYQKDFDKGAERDSDYIYGPNRPQTFFVGATYRLK